jgi:hypothetical protein
VPFGSACRSAPGDTYVSSRPVTTRGAPTSIQRSRGLTSSDNVTVPGKLPAPRHAVQPLSATSRQAAGRKGAQPDPQPVTWQTGCAERRRNSRPQTRILLRCVAIDQRHDGVFDLGLRAFCVSSYLRRRAAHLPHHRAVVRQRPGASRHHCEALTTVEPHVPFEGGLEVHHLMGGIGLGESIA